MMASIQFCGHARVNFSCGVLLVKKPSDASCRIFACSEMGDDDRNFRKMRRTTKVTRHRKMFSHALVRLYQKGLCVSMVVVCYISILQ